MLKIKKTVNLKILANFGFVKYPTCYIYDGGWYKCVIYRRAKTKTKKALYIYILNTAHKMEEFPDIVLDLFNEGYIYKE